MVLSLFDMLVCFRQWSSKFCWATGFVAGWFRVFFLCCHGKTTILVNSVEMLVYPKLKRLLSLTIELTNYALNLLVSI
jgi:hypothetical protein